MKKAHKTTTTRTQGAQHDVTAKKTASLRSLRPTERALHPTTPLEIMVSRALDQELDWYFTYAESALQRDRLAMLPSYAAVLLSEPTDAIVRSRAHDIARVIRGCLLAMRPRHAEVLRSVYTPHSWPTNVHDRFDCLSAIVVRLAFANDPWPVRSARAGIEQAAAVRLSSAIATSRVSVGRLRQQAERVLGSAVFAYAGLRALEGVTGGSL